MANLTATQSRSSFALPILPALVMGSIVTGLFYALLLYGVLEQPTLKRYCTSHPTALIAMWLGSVSLIGLTLKIQNTLAQSRVLRTIDRMLDKIVVEGEDVVPAQRALWLEARWLAVPTWQQSSWTGRRIADLIQRQLRGKQSQAIDGDLRDLSSDSQRQQQNSFALIRTAAFVLPMLGVIGSLVCLSKVLVQAETLTQSGISLSVGLGSAVAPLVVSLAVTIPLLFAMQMAQRVDASLLMAMDEMIRDSLADFLAHDVSSVEVVRSEPAPREVKPVAIELTATSQQATDDLLAAVHQLVEMQSNIWSRSISESQKQWATWSTSSGEILQDSLCQALDKSLSQHALQIEKIQQEAARQVDSRWQQWQITLSDQARVMHAQQKELVRQTEAIERLVTSTCELKKSEEAIYESFANFELLDQLRQTTLGVGEAVAVLATSLERAGLIRGLPVKPRATRRADEDVDDQRKVA